MARTGSLSSKLNVTCLITMELKGNRVLDGGGGVQSCDRLRSILSYDINI